MKPPNRVAFESFLDDTGVRFIGNKHLPMALHLFSLVTNGRLEVPIAHLQAGRHTIDDLFGIFLTSILRGHSHHHLDHAFVGT
ncbi:hypothetical protein VW098_12220 [Phaeobacter sp. JH57H2]